MGQFHIGGVGWRLWAGRAGIPTTDNSQGHHHNLFMYQARESSLVPAGFLRAQFLQKQLVYETFVVMGTKGKV